jgi:hypothetical protein
MAQKEVTIRNPEQEATGNQLWHINRLGLIPKAIANGAGETGVITKGLASKLLDEAKRDGIW